MNKQSNGLRNWLSVAILVLAINAFAVAQQSQTNADQSSAPALVIDTTTAPGTADPAPSPAPPSGSSGITFRGFYFGIHAGHGSGNGDTFINPLPTATQFINLAPQTLHPNPGGAVGGGQIGFNWQISHFVIGVEGDISGSGMDGTQTITPITQNNGTPFPGVGFVSAHQSTSWYATVRPRLGVVLGSRFLVYGTGGLAFASVTDSATTDFRPVGTTQYPASLSKTKTGWAGGAGAEVALNHHWSIGFEYLHYDLGSESMTVSAIPTLPPFQVAYTWQTTANTYNGRLNFRF